MDYWTDIALANGAAVKQPAIGSFQMSSRTLPGVTHRWSRIEDYITEVSNARIWGGVHCRNSTVVGAAMGREIGKLVAASVFRQR